MLYTLKGGYVYTNKEIKQVNVIVDNNEIVEISDSVRGQIIDVTGLYVAPSFIDPHVHMREPGFTDSETIKTGSRAAARGGYTKVFLMPNTNPVISSIEAYNDLLNIIEKDSIIDCLPLVAITKDEQGKELVDFEQFDAVGFSDDGKPVSNSYLMYQAMLKLKTLNKPVLCHCEDLDLVHKGTFNNSLKQENSDALPNLDISETTNVARDLVIAAKTGCHYHVCHLATKESLDLVKFYKSIGCNVTCEVTPHHVVLNDQMIEITPNYKMNPPIRGIKDQNAVIEGIIDGSVDMISTDHAPHSFEKKNKEISQAAFGIVGLETSFPLLYTKLVKSGLIKLERLLDLMSYNVAEKFNLANHEIKVGNTASIVILDLENEYTIDKTKFASKSNNTPFDGWKCYGKVVKTIHKGEIVYEG